MHRPDRLRNESSRHHRAGRLFLVLLAGALMLAAAHPAAAQTTDPYVTYVDTYAGLSGRVGAGPGGIGLLSPPVSQGALTGGVSVTNAALGDPLPVENEADRRLVTGWDLVTLAALGAGAVAVALAARRFQSS